MHALLFGTLEYDHFKKKPKDCILYSEDGTSFKIHKESQVKMFLKPVNRKWVLFAIFLLFSFTLRYFDILYVCCSILLYFAG